MRRDVETYGRRARVAFDADWGEDAARRDFTINAIYLDPDGTVHDPVGGLADLDARRVRFVGEASTRIAEDVLRVLRYYRFVARFGSGPGNDRGDPAARAACRASVALLPKLSGERVAQELVRLLAVADPVPVLRMMEEDRVLAAVLPETLVPGATRLDRLETLIALEPRARSAAPSCGTGGDRSERRRRHRRAAAPARTPSAIGSPASRCPGRSTPPAICGRSAKRCTDSAPSATAISHC